MFGFLVFGVDTGERGGGFPGNSAGKEFACNAGDPGSIPGVRKIHWRRDRLHTLVF